MGSKFCSYECRLIHNSGMTRDEWLRKFSLDYGIESRAIEVSIRTGQKVNLRTDDAAKQNAHDA